MSDCLEYERDNGDTLSLMFNADGGLASAKYNGSDVASHVRMFRWISHLEYLEVQGFAVAGSRDVTLGKRLDKKMRTVGLQVISIRPNRTADAPDMYDVRLGIPGESPLVPTKLIAHYCKGRGMFTTIEIALNDPKGEWGVAKLNSALQ